MLFIGEILMKILKKLLPYWKDILIVTLTLFLNVLGTLLIPRMTVDIINIGVLGGDLSYVKTQGLTMVFIALMASIFMIISVKYATKVATSFAADVRLELFKKVQDLSINQFESFSSSSLIVRATDDVNQLQGFVRIGLRVLLRSPLMFIGAIFMAISTNLKLSTVFIVSLPLTMLVIIIFAKKMLPISKDLRLALDKITQAFRQRLSGIRVIKAFNMEGYEEENFSKINSTYTDLLKKTGDYTAVFGPMIGLIMNLTLVAIVYFASRLILAEAMQVGDLVGFIQYATSIMMSFLFFTMIISQLPRAQASLERINEVLALESDRFTEGSLELKSIESLEFKDLTFTYPGSQAPSLQNISFKVDKGMRLGIIGSTGSGKTTLANLLVRFYDPDSGEILINDRNIKDYDLKSLRDKISYTEQKPSLIAGTVADNILMGDDLDLKEDIITALEIAQADFVIKREDGICSKVAQRGRNFSGGQQQRISIARAVYKKPDLYLIDDSFSALDYKTDKALRKDLYENSKDSLMVIITQRASVVFDADLIVLLDNGKMLAAGSHNQLKASSPEYREILESQDFKAGDING